jgi:hypothetical protein
VSEAKTKLVFGWSCHNPALRVGCSTTQKPPKYLSRIVAIRLRLTSNGLAAEFVVLRRAERRASSFRAKK